MATPIPENQARFTLAEIARATGGRIVSGAPEVVCQGVAIDSRAVVQGGLFVAVRGETQDGAKYLPQALERGAAVVLVHTGAQVPEGVACVVVDDTTRALGDLAKSHRERWGRRVIAITGSAGKTTTKELTAGAFRALGERVLKTEGNLNNQFGVPMTLFCLADEHDLAVLEVGTSGPGEIAWLGSLTQPNVAVVLLAAAAHTEGLGTLDDVATEKASLFSALASKGIGVVNADDEKLVQRVRRDVTTISFGQSEGADVRLLSFELSITGTLAHVQVRGRSLALPLGLIGHAAALDACAALAAVLGLCGDRSLDDALPGLSAVAPTEGRMFVRSTSVGAHVIDDSYNANTSSMLLGLATLKELSERSSGRSIAVLADMKELGALSQREHAQVGEAAVRLGIDILVGAGVEMAHATSAAARLAGGRLAVHPTRIAHVRNPSDAAAVVRSLWRPGDVLLVKGSRGMKMERVVEALCGPSRGQA